MISKEEYIKLYCNDHLAKQGVYALDVNKVMMEMMKNADKTLQDLDDYGLSEAMEENGIMDISNMDVHTGEMRSIQKGAQQANKTATPYLDKLMNK